MFELHTGHGFLSFDGRVLEHWSGRQSGAPRLHIAIIGEIAITAGRKDQLFLDVKTTYGAGNALIPFVAEQRPAIENMVAVLEQAKQAWRARG